MKDEIIGDTAQALIDNGFTVSDCKGTQSCFDIIAKKDSLILLVKVLTNVEGLTQKNALELKKVSRLLSATPLIISVRMKSHMLADDVMYERHDIHVINVNTLSKLDRELPTVYSIRGNYCSRIDPRVLIRLRNKFGMTQQELADLLDISKQSIYRYETTGRMISSIVEKIFELFEEDITMPSRIFEVHKPTEFKEPFRYHSGLKKQVIDTLQRIGFSTTFTNAPFDIIAKEKETVFTAVTNDWRRLERKIEMIETISEIAGGYSVCISERKVGARVQIMRLKDLRRIQGPEEFIEAISDM